MVTGSKGQSNRREYRLNFFPRVGSVYFMSLFTLSDKEWRQEWKLNSGIWKDKLRSDLGLPFFLGQERCCLVRTRQEKWSFRRCLRSATNEIWVVGENNFPSVARTFLFCLGNCDNNFYEFYSGTPTKLKIYVQEDKTQMWLILEIALLIDYRCEFECVSWGLLPKSLLFTRWINEGSWGWKLQRYFWS